MNRFPLSLVVITRNAAPSLGRCLASASSVVDDIVVVDSGSTDETVQIAAQFNARVTVQAFLGFGAQKQLAVALARHDWVLCLDADEQLSAPLAQGIAAAMHAPQHAAYRFARRNRFFGRYLSYGEAYPDWCLRLFDRRQANWSTDAVHEKVVTAPGTSCGTVAGDLLHDSAERLDDYLSKQNRYTDLQSEQLFQAGKRVSAMKIVLSPLARFAKFYVLRRGFLDGMAGFAHIAIGSFFAFIKYAKLAERWRSQDSM